MRRPGIRECVLSAFCLFAVLSTLVAVDGRVRERFSVLVSRTVADGPRAWQQQASDLGSAIVDAARDGAIDHSPLLVFTAVGAALLVFMLRT